jgi:hypothetical protein
MLDDEIHTTHIHMPFHKTTESTNELIGSLNALGLEALLLDNNVVLDNPPGDTVGPADKRNLPSLGDPEGDKVCYIPPPKDPQTDDESSEKSECRLLIQLQIYSLFQSSTKPKTDPS